MWRFKEVREKYRPQITQIELAEEFGVSRDTILRIENEKAQTFHPDLLRAYSEKFNVSIEYLFGLSEISSRDTDITSICDATGLSEDAANSLVQYRKDDLTQVISGQKDPAMVLNELLCSDDIMSNTIIQCLYDYLFFDEKERRYIYVKQYFTGSDGHGITNNKIPLHHNVIIEDANGNELEVTQELLEQMMLDRIRDALRQLRERIREREKN